MDCLAFLGKTTCIAGLRPKMIHNYYRVYKKNHSFAKDVEEKKNHCDYDSDEMEELLLYIRAVIWLYAIPPDHEQV